MPDVTGHRIVEPIGSIIFYQQIPLDKSYEHSVKYASQAAFDGMLGFHTENGSLVFDRLFIWAFSDGTNITVKGLRDHNDSSNPPDVVPGVFIRKIIGIPK